MAVPPAGHTWVPALSPSASFGDFWSGLRLPFTALRLIFAHRKLLLLSAVSAAVTLLALIGIVAGGWAYADNLVGYFWAKPISSLGALFWSIVVLLTFLLWVVVGANIVPLLALSPLQDPISEATEEACGDFRSAPFSLGGLVRSTLFSLGHNLARISVLLAGHALLLLAHFIPGVGSVVWTVLGATWTALWMGAEYLAGPMARHYLPFSEVRSLVRRRLSLALGFGAAIYVILWVPILNCFFVPLAIVGGTLLFRGLQACGALRQGVAPTSVGISAGGTR